MDTLRVDICYRPLRIGWVIDAGDLEAFRRAVQLSYTLWGGRFNPILIADREEETKSLVDLFRVDTLWPIGAGDSLKDVPGKFSYLINPIFHDSLFVGGANNRKYPQVLDIQNAISHLIDSPGWGNFKGQGVRLYTWQPDDPLADLFLVQFGGYPSVEDTGVDYRAMLEKAADATEHSLALGAPIPADTSDHPSISAVSRLGIRRHHSMAAGWDNPGFFVGDAVNVDDLVSHWNLRAADVPLWFVDPKHVTRYAEIIPTWERAMRESVANRREWNRDIAVWSRLHDLDEVRKPFGDMTYMFCRVSDGLWNGLNVRVPMMALGEASVLGVVGQEAGRPKVAFALNK